jgi:hypothetical protein
MREANTNGRKHLGIEKNLPDQAGKHLTKPAICFSHPHKVTSQTGRKKTSGWFKTGASKGGGSPGRVK